ncbi:MAG: hypothetical protein WB760_32980 [Xanthobacteraceae bacterium]|jgi:hypothetical protein
MTDLLEQLKTDFEGQAEWRRGKAAEYPGDDRNLKAAELLDRLEGTVDAVPPLLRKQYEAAFDGPDVSRAVECHSEALRQVGFQSEPANAAAFISGFLAELRDTADDEAAA